MKSRRATSSLIPFESLENRQLMTVGAIQTHAAVRMETSLGRVTVELTPDVTPLTVANFLKYVDAGLYNNTLFHRTAPLENTTNDIVQGGGFQAASGYPAVKTFAPVVNEFANLQPAGSTNEVNVRGTIAMAKTSDPDSATSQFFFNVSDNSTALDNTSNSGGFTTFGNLLGGSIHVADAIANLPRTDASSLNSAFNELPVVQTSSGPNPVIVSSAKAQNVLPVTLDAKTKFATWVDEKGGTATISLSKGTADLTFVGGGDMRYTVKGNRVIITGVGVDLEEVTTHGTNHSSVLAVKSVGGKGPAHIGNITVAGGSLGVVDAGTVQLQGDITAANGSVDRVDLQGTFRSTISTKNGPMTLKIGTALDTSVKTGGTIKSLVAQTWFDDGEVATSLVAKNLNSMEVNGNFSSNLNVTGDVGRLKINGNIGTLGPTVWSVTGSLKDVQVGKVMGLNATVGKTLGSFKGREVLDDAGSGTATKITAGTIGTMTLSTLTNGSTISSTSTLKNGTTGIRNIAISGSMDSSTIRSNNDIGTVTVGGSLTGTAASATLAGAQTSSGIYAGVVATFSDSPVTLPGSFTPKSFASIGTVRVGGTFSNTNIAAPVISNVSLGTVQAAGTKHFGVTAHVRIGQLTGNVKGKSLSIANATKQAGVDARFTALHLANDGAFNGNRFTVKIV